MKNKKSVILMLTGLLLIAAALFWTAHNLREDRRGGEAADSALSGLLQAIPTLPAVPVDTLPTAPAAPQEAEYPDYTLNPKMDMPEMEFEGQRYIGVLRIDSLALELPVITMWSEEALKIAPCRFYGSAYQDDLVIAGHNYTSHFANLGDAQPGDPVTFTDVDGNVFRYEVVCLELLGPNAVDEMVNSGFELSLFSCTFGGEYRRTLRCRRVEDSPVAGE